SVISEIEAKRASRIGMTAFRPACMSAAASTAKKAGALVDGRSFPVACRCSGHPARRRQLAWTPHATKPAARSRAWYSAGQRPVEGGGEQPVGVGGALGRQEGRQLGIAREQLPGREMQLVGEEKAAAMRDGGVDQVARQRTHRRVARLV